MSEGDDAGPTAEDVLQVAQRALAKVVGLERRIDTLENDISELKAELDELESGGPRP